MTYRYAFSLACRGRRWTGILLLMWSGCVFADDVPESIVFGTAKILYLRADRLYFTNLVPIAISATNVVVSVPLYFTNIALTPIPTAISSTNAELPPPPPTNCEMRLNYLESYIQQLRPSKVPVPSLYDFVAVSNRLVALEKVIGEGLPKRQRFCQSCGARIGD